MAKALLIIAPRNFRDEELFHTKEELEKSGIETRVASTTTGVAKGMFGGTAKAELSLEQVKIEEYDAIVFIGGSGASVYYENPQALEIARKADQAGKVLAAICIAPGILANAGTLRNKRATIWNGDFVKMLKAGGAKYTGKAVEVDGKIITANGPPAAREFGRAIAKALR
jgi:protease I